MTTSLDSSTKIKAIETEYKGYRFRSRLEARWAVFFDACGYPWEYEPEGFDLGGGVWYLPDFKIEFKDDNGDTNRFWFEVKPDTNISEFEMKKIELFASACINDRRGPHERLILGYGDYIILDGVPEDRKLYTGKIMEYVTGEKWIIEPVYRGRPSFWNGLDEIDHILRDSSYIDRSPSEKARAARFERRQNSSDIIIGGRRCEDFISGETYRHLARDFMLHLHTKGKKKP